MTDQPKKRTLKNLGLNKETVADLTEAEAEKVEGGAGARSCAYTCEYSQCKIDVVR